MTEADRQSGGFQGKVTRRMMEEAAERFKNWGKWGADDEVGTLNYTSPADIVAAAALVQKGKVFSLALNYDHEGPQGGKTDYPVLNRFNPIHLMLRTGTDAYSGVLDHRKIRAADDLVILPLQCGTQWDALSHVFYGDSMYNGYDIRLVTTSGAAKCGIEKTKNKMVGRGVLLDFPRLLEKEWLPEGFPITNDLLEKAEKEQGVEVRRGDYVLIRTGHIEQKLAEGNWDGYAGGDAPGVAFETIEWFHEKEVAAVATDTWGAEVRPNNSEEYTQPWHWITIPIMGLTMGEIFRLGELAEDCAADKRYEFLFVSPALPITGAVASATNPLAIK